MVNEIRSDFLYNDGFSYIKERKEKSWRRWLCTPLDVNVRYGHVMIFDSLAYFGHLGL